MTHPLPPLAAIRVFEAVARHLSFTRAAEELGMSQAAVSYQIKGLEQRLGTRLFERGARRIALTDAAQRLVPATIEAFNLLRDTYGGLAAPEADSLTINTTPAFGTLWLAPRLGSFRLAHPGIVPKLETTERLIDFAHSDVDIVVRAGDGKWPGLAAIKVMDVQFAPMLSPALAASIGGIHHPADILKLPLLDPRHAWWTAWLRANALPIEILNHQTAPSLGMQAFSAHAAMDGAGVALLTPDYYQRELRDGRLLQPFTAMQAQWDYWLAYPEERRNLRKIKAFRAWIAAEAGPPLPPLV